MSERANEAREKARDKEWDKENKSLQKEFEKQNKEAVLKSEMNMVLTRLTIIEMQLLSFPKR
ncbi:MAG: hypothetical protein ACI92Z_002876 [Paracoccaceae bacterium]|jgi:hypothetical protein